MRGMWRRWMRWQLVQGMNIRETAEDSGCTRELIEIIRGRDDVTTVVSKLY